MSGPAGRLRAVASLGAVLALIVGACGGTQATPTPPPSPTPGLFVDATTDRGSISPLVFGSNTGPTLVAPFDLQEQIKAARITTLTFPGGNWGDDSDIETYQIDQFISYCKVIGAEPRIVVRLRGGTLEKAVELLKYTNVIQKYNVKYWGIGNEADLYASRIEGGYTVDQYNKDWREYAIALKDVDPNIVLVGPDVSQFVDDARGSDYLQFRIDWLKSFLKANGDKVDIVSIHRYAFPVGDEPPTKEDLRQNSKEWDLIIPALRKMIREQVGRDLPVAVTEVNSSWAVNIGGEATLESHYNAIWFADVLGRMIEQQVTMVDQFALAGDYGIVGAISLRPMYYTYMIYQQLGSELVRSATDDPLVSVYAATRDDGTLTVMIVNLASTPQTKPLTIVGGRSSGSAETWLFDQSHDADKVADTQLGGTVTVPAESVTVLAISK
jgi:alpha-L-arabinofuranosidase